MVHVWKLLLDSSALPAMFSLMDKMPDVRVVSGTVTSRTYPIRETSSAIHVKRDLRPLERG